MSIKERNTNSRKFAGGPGQTSQSLINIENDAFVQTKRIPKKTCKPSRTDQFELSGWPKVTHLLWPQRSQLCIGAFDSAGWNLLDESRLWSLCVDYDIVEAGPINNAILDIPAQDDGWSCGINSAGRFMAMLGYPHPDFGSFHHHSPNHPAGHLETGPGTQRLVSYMTTQHSFGDLGVSANMTDDWDSQRSLINLSIAQSRPAMVLVETSSRRLHWVNIIGRARQAPHNYLILDTTKDICEYPGGEETLRSRMDLGNHIVHSIPLRNDRVARFNSISATTGQLPEERCNRRNMTNRTAALRGDRNAVHNLANTLFDSPVLYATPLAPITLFWRLF